MLASRWSSFGRILSSLFVRDMPLLISIETPRIDLRTPPVDLLCHVMYQYLYFYVVNSLHCLQCLQCPENPPICNGLQTRFGDTHWVEFTAYTPWIKILNECLVWGTYFSVVLTCLLVWANFGGHALMICAHDLTLTLGIIWGGTLGQLD